MSSLRTRITVAATVALAIVLVAAAVLIVALVDRQLRNDLADQNESTLAEVTTAIEDGQDPATIPLPVGADGTEFVITDDDGALVRATAVVLPRDEVLDGAIVIGTAGDPDLPTELADLDDDVPFAVFDGDGALGGTVVLADELVGPEPWDLTSVSATAPDGAVFTVEALTPTRIVERSVEQVRSVLVLVIPVLAALFAGSVWFLTGRVLRPVAEMTRRADRIRSDTLHERLTEPGTDDEIDHLATTLNSMLERLDDGARRQRRFVSDASHELRSPLTVMIGEAELAGRSEDTERIAEANRMVVEQGGAMTRLIDDLLALARSDEAAYRRTEVDLDDVVREQVAAQAVSVDTTEVEPVRLVGDAPALGRMVRNLLDNAARHADSRIAVAVRAEGDDAVLLVDDDGPGVPPEVRRTVFERFARADESRSRSTGGSGLGLAIVEAVVHGHDGTVAIETSPLGGARFVVRVPR